MVKMAKRKADSENKDVLEKEEPLVKTKKSNAWVQEVRDCATKDGVSYKEAMKRCSLIRKQGKDTKS